MSTALVPNGAEHPYGNASCASCLTSQDFLGTDGRINVGWCDPVLFSEANEGWVKSWARRIKNAMVIGFWP